MAKNRRDAGKRRGRGEGSIEELPSGKWRAILSLGISPVTGKRDKLTFTSDTKKAALAWMHDRQTEQNKGILADPGKMTVAEWLDRWLELKKPKVEPRSWEPHEQHVRLHLKPLLGNLPLANLRPMHCENIYSGLTANGVSPALQRKIGTTFRMAMKDAVRLQMLAVNPSLMVDQPKATKPDVAIWNSDEVRRFLLAAHAERLGAMYVVALDSGMRQGELFGLHWPQVDFDGSTVFVMQSLEETKAGFRLKPPKSKASKRRIALTSESMTVLNDHRQRMLAEGRDVKTGPVFVDTEGGFLRKNNLHQNSFARTLRKAGVPRIGFHGLRHTSATLLLLNGINIKAVSVRLGHSSIKITLDTYAHFLPEMDTQMVAVLKKVLHGTPGDDLGLIVPR
jgi:integrase